MTATVGSQVQASDPKATVFVAANAGSGKTSTLVTRVARLLLGGARPEAILCVTYTKAGAAEMQRRVFRELGRWAVMEDGPLRDVLAGIDEPRVELSNARALFARALDSPGGLRIQTIHAFCERLLRRFPLEAAVSPGFSVLEDSAAGEVSSRARDDVAALAMAEPDSLLGKAYARFSVSLDWGSFNDMFATFEARRDALAAYVAGCELTGGVVADVWRRCGFPSPTTQADIESEAVGRMRWGLWEKHAGALARGTGKTDKSLAAGMAALGPGASFADVWAIFSTKAGVVTTARLGTQSVDPATRDWLEAERARFYQFQLQRVAAAVAENTVHALTLARAYAGLYEGAKEARGALDFGDLIARVQLLLTKRADAAWVLFKLDGGIEHVLLDEAQDTAPAQWDILRILTAEFFTGDGAGPPGRSMFVVGDRKQSIFSFQGADPRRLAAEEQTFQKMVEGAAARFHSVTLRESWRSRPEILTLVDTVIAIPEVAKGLTPADGDRVIALPIEHVATRDPGGCVELWPKEVGQETEDADPWAPVDSEPATSAGSLLAARIAATIKASVARGDAVADRAGARPCRYRDFLILVRRRSALFHEIIRALKKQEVPVAGADRLKLSEHGLFEDLMALGRFACFEYDDLTLAGVLRGPFCNVDEDGLYDLAYNRGSKRLWIALQDQSDQRPEFSQARSLLKWTRNQARGASPFDFYSHVLNRLDSEGRSMRQRILTRLGAEAEQALDAFLAQALAAEGRGVHDLETFLAAMARTELDIKREQDDVQTAGDGEVRVMTVHGAKGLEAPIVILPDTTTRATSRAGPLLETLDGGFLWARKDDDCPASAAARKARDEATEEESARLLYVALTRARDRLIVCGVQSQPFRLVRSWYDYVDRAFERLETSSFVVEGGGEGRRYGRAPRAAEALPGSDREASPLPAWVSAPAPGDPDDMKRRVSPFDLAGSATRPAPSPLASVNGIGRFRRGKLIHYLLQTLPEVPPSERPSTAHALLSRERDLTDDQRAEMAAAALAVLADPQFAAVFGPSSRAEVDLAGTSALLPAGFVVSGRVDRLVVEEGRVLVVDFKTNRPAPDRIEDADPAYVLQMAIYAALLEEIFPRRIIDAALVWTDGPKLMAVPEEAMQSALAALAAKG